MDRLNTAMELLTEARDDVAELITERRRNWGIRLMHKQQPGIDLLARIDAFLLERQIRYDLGYVVCQTCSEKWSSLPAPLLNCPRCRGELPPLSEQQHAEDDEQRRRGEDN